MIANRETKQQILADVEKPVLRSRVVSNNTVKVWYKDGTVAVRLHHTDVVTVLTDGTVELNTGGWFTPTTKDRINNALREMIKESSGERYCWHSWVCQENSKWYVTDKKGNKSLFYDGMILNKDLNITKSKETDRSKEALLKSINRYCDKIKKLKKLPLPDNGDCWDCLMFDQEVGGEKNTEHLKLHLKEGYVHGSLIKNALQFVGYNPEAYLVFMNEESQLSFCKKVVVRSVRRYLKTRLGIPC